MRKVLIVLAAGALLSACGMSGQDPGAPATRTVTSQVTVTQSSTPVTTSPATSTPTSTTPVVTEVPDPPDPPPAPAPAPKKKATTPKEEPASVYYKNCTEARNAGAAPVRRGDPGYAAHLDRDNDGVGCE